MVVTADRFESTLQKSSLAIQVLSAQDIERAGVTKASDLNHIVPGLQIGTGGNAAQIYIRGVGDFAASSLSNPAVAVNIDGVYIARPQGVNSEFYDLDRIEVLKGPQGTLYGRNASGGAINLITARPKIGTLGGFLDGEAGDYSSWRLEGAVNAPLGEKAAARASFLFAGRNGYLSDGTDDDQRQQGRLRVLIEPTPDLSLLLNGDVAHEGGKGPGYVQLPGSQGQDPWLSASSLQSNLALVTTPPIGFLIPPVGTDTYLDNTFWNLSAELNWTIAPGTTLTVLPAYRDADMDERNYPAGLRNSWTQTSHATSVEARLAHTADRIKAVGGFYYFRESQRSRQQIYQGFLQDNDNTYAPRTTSYAGFGQATFSVTDALRLIGGIRYTHEDKSLSGFILTNSPNGLPPGTPLPALVETFGGDASFSKTTWKAGVEYDAGPNTMVFATVSTGFKAGGFNQTVPPMATYAPETVTAYEVGVRNRLAGGRVHLGLEGFWWDYDDPQVAHVLFDPLGNINLVTQNAGKAKVQGASLDLDALVGAGGHLRVAVEYANARYRQFSYDTAYSIFGAPLFNPASTSCPTSAPFPGPTFGSMLITITCDGRQMPRSPKFSGTVGYDQTFQLGNGGSIKAAVNVTFAASRWLNYEYVSTEHAEPYQVVDLDLTYTHTGGRWSLGAYVHNIGNEAVYTGGGEQAFAPPLVYATIAPPRTWGARARVNFD